MPSADCCSTSDLDCGSAVRYTLQCEYPERPDFGPDKFGAFFGDVELGRIVQEEHVDPLPSTSSATPTPPLLHQAFDRFTSSPSLCTASAALSDQSSSSAASQYDKGSPQYARSASYVAEHAAFVNEYAELNQNPDLRCSSGIRNGASRSNQQYRAPPDYVCISVVLLVCTLPCAGLALYWALQAKRHMKRGQNGKAWLQSNKAFNILLLGLLCLFVICLSVPIAGCILKFSKNRENPRPENKPNDPEADSEAINRFHNSTPVVKDERLLGKSPDNLLANVIPSSSTTTAPLPHKPSARSVTATRAPTTDNSQGRRGGSKRSKANQPNSKTVQPTGPSKVLSRAEELFPDITAGTHQDQDSSSPNSKHDSPDDNTPNAQVPKFARELFGPNAKSRTSTTTAFGQSEQLSNLKTWLNNPQQLPIKTTTTEPSYQSVESGDSGQAAGEVPRQIRHRRNVRQRPRGRRKRT